MVRAFGVYVGGLFSLNDAKVRRGMALYRDANAEMRLEKNCRSIALVGLELPMDKRLLVYLISGS